MALVNYGSDSEAESGDDASTPKISDHRQPKPSGLFSSLPRPSNHSNSAFVGSTAEKKSGLFASLPAPKPETQWLPEAVASSKPRKREPIVFTVHKPAESDSDDDEAPVVKRTKIDPAAGGSGLFSMLPAPKSGGVSSARKAAVSNKASSTRADGDEDATNHASDSKPKPKPATTTASMVPYALQKKRQEAQKAAAEKQDDDDDEEYTGSFFKSLTAPNQAVMAVEERFTQPVESQPEPAAYPAGMDGDGDDYAVGPYPDASGADGYGDDDVIGAYPGADDAYAGYYQQQQQQQPLDVHMIQAFEGKRAQADLGSVTIIDANAATEIGNSAQWRQQYAHMQPAAPSMSEASKKADKLLGGQAKRKHQITHLAALAKAQQSELEQRWATNKFTKKQLGARYGF